MSTSPLPSSGLPSGSTMRPSSPLPTGISSSLPERLTVSPSSILSQSPNSTTPTLSASRLSASPVTSCGSSTISSDWQLSSPCTRAMPSAIDRTVPTSDRSAPPSSRPSILALRMLVISSGLIFMSAIGLRRSPLGGLGHLLPKSFQSGADRSVHHHVSDPHHQAADHVGVDLRGQLHLAAGLLLDLPADLLDEPLVQLHGARDRHGQQLALFSVESVERAPDPEQRRHPVPLGEQLEEADEVLLGALDHLGDALLLLLRREVRREEEHLHVAVRVELVRELPELLVDVVEHILVLSDLEQGARVDLGQFLHYSPPPLPPPLPPPP